MLAEVSYELGPDGGMEVKMPSSVRPIHMDCPRFMSEDTLSILGTLLPMIQDWLRQ